jgi:hypothetical protein
VEVVRAWQRSGNLPEHEPVPTDLRTRASQPTSSSTGLLSSPNSPAGE